MPLYLCSTENVQFLILNHITLAHPSVQKGFEYNRGLILFTAVPSVDGPFLAIDILDIQQGWQTLLDNYWVGDADCRHIQKALDRLQDSDYLAV